MSNQIFSFFQLAFSLLFIVSTSSSPPPPVAAASSVATATFSFPIAKPGCNDSCGNVTVPYPFGIGPGCALNQAYMLWCESDGTLYLSIPSAVVTHQVLSISLRDQTVTLNVAKDPNCASKGASSFGYVTGTNLTGTPFYFSREFNKLMLLGCGNALLNQINGQQPQSGCTSMCDPSLSSTINDCYGINCCQTNIPFDLDLFWMNFTIPSPDVSYPCVSGFLVDQNWKPLNYSSNQLPDIYWNFPVVVSWTLLNLSDVDSISGCGVKNNSLRLESGNITNYQCECTTLGPLTWIYEINPYLDGACYNATSIINKTQKNTKVIIIVGVTVGAGTLFLMISVFTLYKLVRKRRNKMRKEKFFKRNGGLLLQRQLSANEEGVIDQKMLFTAKELIRATDGFNDDRILGQGGQGTVYKGMLRDGKIVAIKRSKKVDESQLEQFINEVVILSQVIHRNVVRLLGCCLETEVPLLVYEFIPNGTLHGLIHNGDVDEFPFTWNFRLRIATEVAGAIAYLHSAISIPIFHRDIKTSNILLDEKYIAKVSDFGTSMSVAVDKTHLTTLVKGTFGYLDPEYFQSSQFTEKSDVYSFGVVLVELLTRQKAISSTGTGEDANNFSLATRFLTSMEQGSLSAILDPQVVDCRNEEEVVAVAKLAQQCLNLNGKNRPTMKEVAIKLENIKLLTMQSMDQGNIQVQHPMGYESNWIFDNSTTTSTFTTGSESFSLDLDAYPLLHSSV